ncbi:Tcp11-domain-containing protein [Artomyces pyxidatus]|uniref:Tcp11-domain-containing protein n=1 Tax=Artomyces pyxidatus TaxID=48021 RepID=A0ACB8SZQ9_9AGAM|nr:Tcp11-domain-containing protein [Artomyces pyxidatus]
MDDLAHESVPIHSLARKRKADTDDCDVNDNVRDASEPMPSKLNDPPIVPPRLSLETSQHHPSQSAWFPNGLSVANSPLSSPSSPPSASPSSPSQVDSPSRAKRPRIDTSPALKSNKRAATKRAQELVTALQMLQGSWRWVTSRSGDTRLVAPIPRQPSSDPTSAHDLPPTSPTSPDSITPSSSRIVIPIDPCSPHIPVRHPPINKDTLKELDLEAIMRNPQLRHDFLFDSGLQFRAAASRRKRDQAETYWRAVLLELETGCTCVTFDIHGRPHSLVCVCKRLPTPPADPVIACLPLRRRLTLRMPSRIRPLLKELLVVLLSIIKPQASAVSSVQGGNVPYQQRVKQHAEQAQKLRSVLDAELIDQEMKHGLYDPSGTFRVIGEVLKSHCAPMRDQAVDSMVQMADRCAPGGGGSKADAIAAMRECFEILELMKLDIANHQMQTLRPYIIHSSPDFELRMFREQDQSRASLLITRQWLVSAHRRLESTQYALKYPTRSLPFKTLGKRTRVILSALKGLIDLVFNPPSPVPLSSPIITTTAPSHLTVPTIIPQLPDYPETLYLDHSRLIQLSKDSADLTTIYMFLMLYRQLVFASSPEHPSPRCPAVIEDTDLRAIKEEIYEVGPHNIGRCFLPIRSATSHHQAQHEAKDLEQWTSGMQSVVLQVTSRASEVRRRVPHPKAALPGSTLSAAPEPHVLKLAESWTEKHLRMDSPLGTLMRDRLRDAVFDVLVETVLIRGNITPQREARPRAAAGLEPLADEIRQLAERLAKLAVLHLNVFQTVYEQDEFSSEW